MPISTKLTKALGIKAPIIQGGMHYVGYAPLVSAVGEAGGIGCVTALTQPSAEALQNEIRLVKKMSTRPFGVNLTFLPSVAAPDMPAYVKVIIDSGVKIVEPGIPNLRYSETPSCRVADGGLRPAMGHRRWRPVEKPARMAH